MHPHAQVKLSTAGANIFGTLHVSNDWIAFYNPISIAHLDLSRSRDFGVKTDKDFKKGKNKYQIARGLNRCCHYKLPHPKSLDANTSRLQRLSRMRPLILQLPQPWQELPPWLLCPRRIILNRNILAPSIINSTAHRVRRINPTFLQFECASKCSVSLFDGTCCACLSFECLQIN